MSRKNLNTMLPIDLWQKIWKFKLCLRSHDDVNIMPGLSLASYVMTDNTDPIGGKDLFIRLKNAPEDWEEKLMNTLKMIKGFDNSNSRYLHIIGSALSGTDDYLGCFPKTTAPIENVYGCTNQFFSCNNLYNWVLYTISNIH